jgi:hypothetical protein
MGGGYVRERRRDEDIVGLECVVVSFSKLARKVCCFSEKVRKLLQSVGAVEVDIFCSVVFINFNAGFGERKFAHET